MGGPTHKEFVIPSREILRFAQIMQAELNRHAPIKGANGWKRASVVYLRACIDRALRSLDDALLDQNGFRIAQQCADVANYCMMIAWLLGQVNPKPNGYTENYASPTDIETLFAIEQYRRANHGINPSYHDLMLILRKDRKLPTKAPTTFVHARLERAERAGLLKRDPNVRNRRRGAKKNRKFITYTKLGREILGIA